MTLGSRRGVTRGYVGGLIVASGIVAVTLVIASWGVVSVMLDRDPVEQSSVPVGVAPLIVSLDLALLMWVLWSQALLLLRGRVSPAWGYVIFSAFGAYLLWCLGGAFVGMGLQETWISPFALLLALIWGVVCLLFWAVLFRRLYTDRPSPSWPWEGREPE